MSTDVKETSMNQTDQEQVEQLETSQDACPSGTEKPKKKKHLIRRIFLVVIVVAVGIGVFSAKSLISKASSKIESTEQMWASMPDPDEEQVTSVNNLPAYGVDDTWAVYVYLVGSDLESHDTSSLGEEVAKQVEEQSAEYQARSAAQMDELRDAFEQDIEAAGLELPSSYLESATEDSSQSTENEIALALEKIMGGSASNNLDQLFSVELPENVTFVIETGGSKSWTNENIDAEHTQRFVYDNDGFRLVESNPLSNMGESATLADFLDFCVEGYTADHCMVLLWNHGAGAFGYGVDELYGRDYLTLSEIQEAFASSLTADEDNPPLELIGFDACLMSGVEVADALCGYGHYLVATEETESDTGWNYASLASTLAQHPEYNGAQVGVEIVESYLSQNKDNNTLDGACMSVIDLSAANELYDAYAVFAKAALEDAVDDASTLVDLATCATSSVRFAQDSADTYNTVDLGMFMEQCASDYPDETDAVLSAISDCVLYNRGASYTKDTLGISVYFPANLSSEGSYKKFLLYVNDVCHDDAIKALYTYKVAGCLNDEQQEVLASMGMGEAKPIDTSCMAQIAESDLFIGDDGCAKMTLSDEVLDVAQNAVLHVSKTDEDTTNVEYVLGEDVYYDMEDESVLTETFRGTWMQLDGHLLRTDIIDVGTDYVRYKAPLQVNGERRDLIFTYYTDGSFSIAGTRAYTEDSFVVDKNLEALAEGDEVACVYDSDGYFGDDCVFGESFTITADSKIEDAQIEDGTYLAYFTFTDIRGGQVDSKPIKLTVEGDTVTRELGV